MPFSYHKLWKLLIDQGMTRTELRKTVGASTSTFAKMSKGGNVSLEVIDRICTLMGCRVEDIIEHIPPEK